MKKITALRSGRGRGKRVKVFLDGKLAFSLEPEVVAEEQIQVEQALSTDQSEALAKSDHFHRCLNAALRYLGLRPRSEAELIVKLCQRGFANDNVEAVITRLREQGLVDDTAFAQFWKDNRESFSPRSQRLTRLELRQKGVANNIIDQVVGTIDENDSAYRAALGKARSLDYSDYQSFYRRLGGYLKRRGFSYAVISHTIERLWQDKAGDL